MSLLFMDGCDHLTSSGLATKWDSPGNTVVYPTDGRFGGGAIAIPPTVSAGCIKAVAPKTPFTGVIGYWLKGSDPALALGALLNYTWDLQIHGVSTPQLLVVGFGPTGEVLVRQGSYGGPILGQSGPGVMSNGTWVHLEYAFTIDATKGSFEVRADGTPVLLLSGVNTGAEAWARVEFGPGEPERHDDIVILDTAAPGPGAAIAGAGLSASFLGPTRIYTQLPNRNGSILQWTGVYTALDDPQFNADSDFEYARVKNKTSSVGMTPVDSALAGIRALQLNGLIRKVSSSAPSTVRQLYKGTDGLTTGPAIAPVNAYTDYREIYYATPGGAVLTAAAVNAAEFQIKREV